MFGEESWAYPGDSEATVKEGYSPAPLVDGQEFTSPCGLPDDDESGCEPPSQYGPDYWIDIFGQATAPAAASQAASAMASEEPLPWWVWAGGFAIGVLAIRALK